MAEWFISAEEFSRAMVDSMVYILVVSGAKYPDTLSYHHPEHTPHTVTRYLLLNFASQKPHVSRVYPPDAMGGRRVYGSIKLKSWEDAKIILIYKFWLMEFDITYTLTGRIVRYRNFVVTNLQHVRRNFI